MEYYEKLVTKKESKTSKIALQDSTKREQVLRSVAIIAKNILDSITSTNQYIPSLVTQSLGFVLGSSIDILISVHSSQEMDKRLKLLVDQLNKNFQKIDNMFEKIDKNFEVYWRKAIRGSLESSRKEKITLFANILTNHALDNSNPFSTKTSILNDLDFLELEHIKLLDLAYENKLQEDQSQRNDPSYTRVYLSLEAASKKLKEEYPHVWKLATDLLGRGLLVDPEVGLMEYSGFRKITVPKYGEYFTKAIKSYET